MKQARAWDPTLSPSLACFWGGRVTSVLLCLGEFTLATPEPPTAPLSLWEVVRLGMSPRLICVRNACPVGSPKAPSMQGGSHSPLPRHVLQSGKGLSLVWEAGHSTFSLSQSVFHSELSGEFRGPGRNRHKETDVCGPVVTRWAGDAQPQLASGYLFKAGISPGTQ